MKQEILPANEGAMAWLVWGGVGRCVLFCIGYKICFWRKRFGRLEADLILSKGGGRFLVEVKAGFQSSFLRKPENQLSFEKIKNLRKIAQILGGGKSFVPVELFVVDFSNIWPRIRRYPKICLW